MTRTFATDANNDLFIGPADVLVIAEGIQATKFAAEQAAKTLLGEMVLAANQGVPYFPAVWNGRPDLQQFEAALRVAILAVDGVDAIVSLTVRLAGELLTYSAEIETTFGTVSIDGL